MIFLMMSGDAGIYRKALDFEKVKLIQKLKENNMKIKFWRYAINKWEHIRNKK